MNELSSYKQAGLEGPDSGDRETYEICLEGHLDCGWSEWFAGLAVTHLESGRTMLAGPVPDQAALHGLLARIRDLNLVLVSINIVYR